MSSVYLHSAVLHSALADNLTDAALAVQQGQTAHYRDFLLHDREQSCRYFSVAQQQPLLEHLHANISSVHSQHAIPFADCLLIIASTGLNIHYFEALTHKQKKALMQTIQRRSTTSR